MRKKLGVNIDHVATIRNARKESYPEPLKAALIAQVSGADSITIHLREDRRHVIESDLFKIKENLKIPINLEIAPTNEMLRIVLKHKPRYICIVPEKRAELTTEGGLNLNKTKSFIKKIVYKVKLKKIRVSLFIEPSINNIKIAKSLSVDAVELHTGKYCNLFNKGKNYNHEFKKIKKAAYFAYKNKIEVHAGHGLTYKSATKLSQIKHITEFNIGHFIISDSIFVGLKKVIKKFKLIINK